MGCKVSKSKTEVPSNTVSQRPWMTNDNKDLSSNNENNTIRPISMT